MIILFCEYCKENEPCYHGHNAYDLGPLWKSLALLSVLALSESNEMFLVIFLKHSNQISHERTVFWNYFKFFNCIKTKSGEKYHIRQGGCTPLSYLYCWHSGDMLIVHQAHEIKRSSWVFDEASTRYVICTLDCCVSYGVGGRQLFLCHIHLIVIHSMCVRSERVDLTTGIEAR